LLLVAQHLSTMNYDGVQTTPSEWTSVLDDEFSFTTTGNISACAAFSHYFDVVMPGCDPLDDDCTVLLYQQDFDALPSDTGDEENVWVFLDALPGWNLHNNNDSRRVGSGTNGTGAIYSFGATDSSERALGGVASGNTGTQYWGFCYTNEINQGLSGISIRYTGEQWRQTSEENQHDLEVEVSVAQSVIDGFFGSEFHEAPTGDPETGWAPVPALTFTGPQAGSGSGALDGNATENQELIHGVAYEGELQPNDTLCFRWVDIDDAGFDHGLAIDDVVLRAVPVE
jgi:uncharacterized protein